MAKKLNGKGKVLEDRHLLDLALDTGTNGDEMDQLMIVAASRKELKTLCGILQGIGDGEAWLRLCLSIRLECLNKQEKTWEKMNLFSVAYNDKFFGKRVTIRVLRGDLFFPVYLLSMQKFTRGQLSRAACNECVEVFQKSGWDEAVHHLERMLGLKPLEVVSRILELNGKDVSAANV